MAKLTEVYITVRVYTENDDIPNPLKWGWNTIGEHIRKEFNRTVHITNEYVGKDRYAELVLAQHMVDDKPVVVFKKENVDA